MKLYRISILAATLSILLSLVRIANDAEIALAQEPLEPETPTSQVEPTESDGPAEQTPSDSVSTAVHTVEPGDVLIVVAHDYNTTIEAIMAANEITNPDLLSVGQDLTIPIVGSDAEPVEAVTYSIQDGDTLLDLAIEYDTSLEAISTANPDLEPTLLQIGETVVIPLDGEESASATVTTAPENEIIEVTSLAAESASIDLHQLEIEMFEAVNSERQARGLPPYAWTDTFAGNARLHAEDMASRGYFSHVTPEGLTLRDRVAAQGIDIQWVGENIQTNTKSADGAVEEAIAWFMPSQPHRENILNTLYTELGVGVAEGPAGWYIFVLVFAGE